jgi:hypothetical protein
VRTEDIDIGGVLGFKAYAEVVHDQTGTRVSSAESICMRDEENWSTRGKYEWQDGKRVKVGEENVPLHQVMSMAQTRALSKALAAKFRWVVVLGGWSATPAEEMTGSEHSAEHKAEQSGQDSRQAGRDWKPKFRFGKFKDIAIDSETVPDDYLTWALNAAETNLGSEKRKNYVAQDKEWIVQLKAEITRRNQKQTEKPEPEQPTEQMATMTVDAWLDLCQLWFDTQPDAYEAACKEFKTNDASKLPNGQWPAFKEKIKVLSK